MNIVTVKKNPQEEVIIPELPFVVKTVAGEVLLITCNYEKYSTWDYVYLTHIKRGFTIVDEGNNKELIRRYLSSGKWKVLETELAIIE